MNNIKLYCGDCLVEMDKIADKSVDLILCDLPYGITDCSWDVIIPFDKLWENQKCITRLKLEEAGLKAYKLWLFME